MQLQDSADCGGRPEEPVPVAIETAQGLVLAARDVADRLNPGGCIVTADDF